MFLATYQGDREKEVSRKETSKPDPSALQLCIRRREANVTLRHFGFFVFLTMVQSLFLVFFCKPKNKVIDNL